jgi:hypothetical protein
MRTDSLMAIAAALEGKTRTRAELSAITDLSYPTVLRALEALQAEEVPETWPREYTIKPNAIAGAQERSRQVIVKADSVSSVFGPLRLDRWQHDIAAAADEWAKYRKAMLNGVEGIKFEQGVDPHELFNNLCGGAAIMASFALAIQPHLDDPLWHDKISGGKLKSGKLHLVEDDGLDTEDA